MDLLSNLNESQKEAVTTTDGPVLVLAGAGSGKTRTLTRRVVYLLLQKKVSPERLLVVTFTNKAANEMKERVEKLLKTDSDSEIAAKHSLPWLGTFHSICVRILRREIGRIGFQPSFAIYDEDDQEKAIKIILSELDLDKKSYASGLVLSLISSAKNELVGPSEYAKYANNSFLETVAEIYSRYQKLLKASNALDFDDLLMLPVRIFTEFPEVLEKYQRLWKYILIDEYQDTNTAQYTLVKMLAGGHRNLFVVGDDLQSIYSWRGANFRNILNFQKDWPEATVIKLEQNYRSTQMILDAAHHVIVKNTERTDKKLVATKDGGVPVTVYEALNEQDEAGFILTEIRSLIRAGVVRNLNEAVVLYRTNAQSRAIEEECLNSFTPYRIIGGIRFYERKEVKDVIAYLRVLINPDDRVSRDRIINVPSRGIGAKTLSLADDPIERIENPKLKAFFELIQKLQTEARNLAPADVIDLVIEKSGYKESLDLKSEEGEERLENIEELKTVAKNFDKLEEFLGEVALLTDMDRADTSREALTLMTMHAAKGLEFEAVFITGMEEGIFPHARTLTEWDQLEEERRLCYVGMTRAKERLYLLRAEERRLYGGLQVNPPSRFLEDIPEELIERI